MVGNEAKAGQVLQISFVLGHSGTIITADTSDFV